MHQLTGMLLLLTLVAVIFIAGKKQTAVKKILVSSKETISTG
jgi:hypothetical protein